MVSPPINEPWLNDGELRRQADRAKEVYIAALDPEAARDRWHDTIDEVARAFAHRLREALKADRLESVIESSGDITQVLRQLTAPPLSQDQFALICPDYSKNAEKNARPIPTEKARRVADAFRTWLDPRILDGVAGDRITEVAAGPLYLLARQQFETDRRIQAAQAQEQSVITLLEDMDFVRTQSRTIDQPWTVGARCYMHKTTFSSAARSTAEVDIAVGLDGDRLLAIECKVSNDATNSVKRINDVLKKRASWKDKYGEVLTTGAVLSGVFAHGDIDRLAAERVCVFFSHDLGTLEQYLSRPSCRDANVAG